MATVVVLLFVMGVEIGANDDLLANLPSLGGTALAVAAAATCGSLAAAWVAYGLLFKGRGGADER